MDRREVVKYISFILGGSLVAADALITGCRNSDSNSRVSFSAKDVALMNEIADTILPPTDTPGAKEAKVGEQMKVMVNDCYEERDQYIFRNGLSKIDELSEKDYSNKFIDLKPGQRLALLTKLDKEQKESSKTISETDPKHFFRLMKELTLVCYFTSEIGCTKARRYVETPGRYEACIPYRKGDKAFA